MDTKYTKELKFSGYTHRFLARFIIEAKTPLAVGSGEKNILTDALVATDVNGLPYIPGTSIAGVIRHLFSEKDQDTALLFGTQTFNESLGSKIIFTEGKILNSQGDIIDGLNIDAIKKDPTLMHYSELPIRQHVRINDAGVTDKSGKFDEQVVYAGTRFCFEIEMVSDGENYKEFESALKQLHSKTFRIGSGTRCGFGEIEVVDMYTANLNLKTDLQSYLDKPSDLQQSSTWKAWEHQTLSNEDLEGWTQYELKLQPEDFFLFGSGFGNEDADMTPVKAKRIVWQNGKSTVKEEQVLIPATSIKGALSHRVAFHYNKLEKVFANNLSGEDRKQVVGKNNKAVYQLFGSEGEKVNGEMKGQSRGNLIFSDLFKEPLPEKILNHVSIDRFTGGAIDGALFSEKTTYGNGADFTFTIWANNKALAEEHIAQALERALYDICQGLLPLGGGVNRGNGVFTGKMYKDCNEYIPETKMQ